MIIGLSSIVFVLACSTKEPQQTNIEPPPLPEPQKQTILVQRDGTYPTVPLAKEEIVLTVVQTNAEQIKDITQAKAILKKNSNHMIEMGRKACGAEQKPDILVFHEFPLSGYFLETETRSFKWQLKFPVMKAVRSLNLQ